jgi:DNA polymerase-3 subunit alpha/error-prone DNA polymerase
MVAVINNQGGFYRTEVYVHEAKMSGGIINTPCVNKSECETTVYGVDVYLGFMQLEGLDSKTAHRIVADRNTNGEYQSLENFINRIPIGRRDPNLDFHRCLPFYNQNKNQLLVIARLILVNYKPENRNLMLLQEPVKNTNFPY